MKIVALWIISCVVFAVIFISIEMLLVWIGMSEKSVLMLLTGMVSGSMASKTVTALITQH